MLSQIVRYRSICEFVLSRAAIGGGGLIFFLGRCFEIRLVGTCSSSSQKLNLIITEILDFEIHFHQFIIKSVLE